MADRRAEVTVTLDVMPDPRVKPYEIQVELAGLFATHDATEDELREFCQRVAPTILFPYIRQIVSNVTSDARFGRILLPPLNLHVLIAPDQWIKEGVLPQDPAEVATEN